MATTKKFASELVDRESVDKICNFNTSTGAVYAGNPQYQLLSRWLAVVSRTWCLSGCLWDVSVYALVTIVVVIRFVCSTMLFAVVGPALLVAVAVPRYLLL